MNKNIILPLVSKIIKPLGFIKLVDISPRIIYDGNLNCDYAVAEAARVSYSSGTKKVNNDESLINYLYSNEHTTPFEMITFKFHIKAPIFVVRQWQRHRMSTYNEISGRYSIIEETFWYPEQLRKQSIINNQGSCGFIDKQKSDQLINHWKKHLQNSYKLYNHSINSGVSRELARTILPLNTYTEFYWKIDLHNLLRFIKLRNDNHAQEEIRAYASALNEIIKIYCPISVKAFENYSKNSIKLSAEEIEIIRGSKKEISSKSGNADFKKKLELLLINLKK